jgi:hypothetical protein
MNNTEKNYIDITGDLIAGLLLYAIQTEKKNIIEKDGHHWVVRTREGWWNEIRITKHQFSRAVKILKEKNIVVTKIFKLKWGYTIDDVESGIPITHIRINEDVLDQF